MSSFDFTRWTRALTARGYAVLPSSHAVPVSLWLREGDPLDGRVLHFGARGTRLRLSVYEPSDLTTLILRAACDCEEHRQAGAAGRVVLNPGAVAVEVHELDGAAVFGWRGHEAALLPVQAAAGVFESLVAHVSRRATERAATA